MQVDVVADEAPSERARELAVEVRAAIRALFDALGGRRLTEVLNGVDDPSALADLAGWWPDLSFERKVELLETVELEARYRSWSLAWAKEALAEHELSRKIRDDVSDGIEKNQQRSFLLRQQGGRSSARRAGRGRRGRRPSLVETFPRPASRSCAPT